ncbi:uncharacterized protein Z519_09797 [Cladophialophora bantiana CBS 173.52]|uniref:FMN-dependent dehydrogenase domain-containing protein n=1 Tax=Cladophialophora bantiana (strain ATCC 10958 / CBS 173.52 / CDC B-1940 / NIH 8579) TaxID=1442370 RepID=A0A0D2EHU1_CLAB1|nr:uncharacterized protein Z519_09797 [Cladophialophora bantiana CBS 173.52]KIW89641.1 hypothetical protein Z519_09797 [Cladophialophora bantiana CBS 173.52]
MGGETEFADSRTAYEALSPEWKERVENMLINCSLVHNRRTGAPDLYKDVDPMKWSISRWKAVYPHEGSGRKNLDKTSYGYKIDGMSVEESQKITGELIAHKTQAQFVYKLSWNNPGDTIMTARNLGYEALFITVDASVIGKREEDERYKAELDYAARGAEEIERIAQTTANEAPLVLRGTHSYTLSWDDLRYIRDAWGASSGPVVIKGIQTGEDTKIAADM